MRALLDVNVLIALLDAGHAMHAAAMAWLERELPHGWASCPITQNGVVRIMAQPSYPTSRPARLVAERKPVWPLTTRSGRMTSICWNLA